MLRRLATLSLLAGAGILVGIPSWWVASRPELAAGSLSELGDIPTQLEGERPPRPLALYTADERDAPKIPTRSIRLAAFKKAQKAGRGAPRPVKISIPAIDVRAGVVRAGVEAKGLMALPEGPEAGWYRFGASPGEKGSTVIAGHVDLEVGNGVFRRLGEVGPGDRVFLVTADDRKHAYRVVARRRYDKEKLPDRIWAIRGKPILTLITCGGEYDASARSYESNTVLYAVPARS